MDQEEFAAWMEQLAARGVYTDVEAEDFKRQRALFDERREEMEALLAEPGIAAVGFVAGDRVATGSIPAIVALAGEEFPGHMLYFETSGLGG